MGNQNQTEHGSAKKHEQHDQWSHYAHYAHEGHLAAEGVEFAAHKLHHASEFLREAQAAAKLVKTHGQMAYDLRRMAVGITKLENLAKQGGARAVAAARKLSDARAAYQMALTEFSAERSAVNSAHGLMREFKAVQSGVKGKSLVSLGAAAAKFETVLSGSRVGRQLLTVGRVTSSKCFVRGLVVVGAALEGVASYADSTARTTGGQVANGVLGAGGGALTMANPYVAVADLIAPKGYKLSEVYHGGAGAVTAIGEGVFKNDTRAMDEFHKRSMQGHYGKVMQAASEAGEYWADKGIVGGLKEFVDAVHWWVSH